MTELLIASVVLGFFATIISVVAIVYREIDVAKEATKVLGKLIPRNPMK